MKMFVKICKIVRNSHQTWSKSDKLELVGHVIEEVVNRNIKTKCTCV